MVKCIRGLIWSFSGTAVPIFGIITVLLLLYHIFPNMCPLFTPKEFPSQFYVQNMKQNNLALAKTILCMNF